MFGSDWLKETFAQRRWVVLLGVAVCTVGAVALASQLTVSPELKSLLPESSEAVRDLEGFRAEYSADLNPMALLVEGPDAEANRAAVEGLAEVLEGREDVESVWLQLGIRHEDAGARVEESGRKFVQDECIKVEHARLVD